MIELPPEARAAEAAREVIELEEDSEREHVVIEVDLDDEDD